MGETGVLRLSLECIRGSVLETPAGDTLTSTWEKAFQIEMSGYVLFSLSQAMLFFGDALDYRCIPDPYYDPHEAPAPPFNSWGLKAREGELLRKERPFISKGRASKRDA